MVIVDTCVFIDHLRLSKKFIGVVSALDTLSSNIDTSELAISVLTVQELLAGRSMTVRKEYKRVEKILEGLTLFPYDLGIANLAGQIERESTVDLSFVDAAIAATALANHCELYTLNAKHFQTIPYLHLYKN